MELRRFLQHVAAMAVAAFVPAGVFAQSGTSTIAGFVKDVTGAVVPGARVHVVHEDTGVAFAAVTDGVISSARGREPFNSERG